MRKNSHSRILKGEFKQQYLNIIPKFYSFFLYVKTRSTIKFQWKMPVTLSSIHLKNKTKIFICQKKKNPNNFKSNKLSSLI